MKQTNAAIERHVERKIVQMQQILDETLEEIRVAAIDNLRQAGIKASAPEAWARVARTRGEIARVVQVGKAGARFQGEGGRFISHEEAASRMEGAVYSDDTLGNVPYWIEYGTREHDIFPVNATVLKFEGKYGETVFAPKVHHPGTAATLYMTRAIESARPRFFARIQTALTF